MTTPTVLVSCHGVGKKVDPRTIRRRAERLLTYLNLNNATVSIVLTNDTFIQELNRTYRNIDKPTDVLSFPMKEGDSLEGDNNLLGDIVISIDTAERQAPLLEYTLTEELTSLLIHGLLHLLGYDHVKEHDEIEMQSKANQLAEIFSKHTQSPHQQSSKHAKSLR